MAKHNCTCLADCLADKQVYFIYKLADNGVHSYNFCV